jgi:hypothetical protein
MGAAGTSKTNKIKCGMRVMYIAFTTRTEIVYCSQDGDLNLGSEFACSVSFVLG